jgi:hypothetical protein
MTVPSEIVWSDRLRDYADFVFAPDATAARRRDVVLLLGNVRARQAFINRWHAWRNYFRRCAMEPGWLYNEPERMDEAVVKLGSYARFTSRQEWVELFAILDEIAYLADQTRKLRQQLHASRWRPIASA